MLPCLVCLLAFLGLSIFCIVHAASSGLTMLPCLVCLLAFLGLSIFCIVHAASSAFLHGLLVVIRGRGAGSFIIRSTGDPRLIFMFVSERRGVNKLVKVKYWSCLMN